MYVLFELVATLPMTTTGRLFSKLERTLTAIRSITEQKRLDVLLMLQMHRVRTPSIHYALPRQMHRAHTSALHGPGLYIISRAGPGLGLHVAGPGRAWAEKKLNTSGLGRAWA